MGRKSFLTNPVTYFYLTVILYAVFETLNGTVVCQSGKTIAITGLFSFLGFWSLVATIVLTFRLKQAGGGRHWLWVAIPMLILALFVFDFYLARGCTF